MPQASVGESRSRTSAPDVLHALAHALVRGDRHDDDPELDAPAEELVAETTAYSVCASSGVDPGEFSIAYLAGGANTRRSPRSSAPPALIDRLSRRIEDAVATVMLAESDDAEAPRLRGAASGVSEAAVRAA